MESEVRTLSLSFSTDAIYASLTQAGAKGIDVVDLAVLNEQAVADAWHNPERFMEQIDAVAAKLCAPASGICVSIPDSAVHYSIAPNVRDASDPMIHELIQLELRHLVQPMVDAQTHCVQMQDVEGQPAQMLICSYDGRWQQVLEQYAALRRLGSAQVQTGMHSAYASFRYNYPELVHENVALVGMQGDGLSLSVYSQDRLLSHVYEHSNNPAVDTGRVQNVLADLLDSHIDRLTAVYCFGDALKARAMTELQSVAPNRIATVERLNTFRLCSAELDPAHRQYAQRMAHRFALCIGSAINIALPSSLIPERVPSVTGEASEIAA